MKKLIGLLSAVLVAAVFCCGAFAAEKAMVYNLQVEPRTIDPALNNAVDGSQVICNIFEGLFRIGFDDRPEPGCAESWDVSEDHLTWTFHLRPGLKWHDGSPLTAEHFRYGFLRVVDPEVASPYARLGLAIKNAQKFYKGEGTADEVGIKAIDDTTLEIQFEYLDPLVEDHLAFFVFSPAKPEVVEPNPRSWTSSPETIICNGPFYLSEWKHSAELTLTKNPYYWDADNVKIDRVRCVMIGDPNTALSAFKGGKLDLMMNLPPMLKSRLIATGEAKVAPTMGVSFSVFNVNEPPFNDVRVRQAFALAIDREALVKKVTMSGEIPADGFIPYSFPGPTGSKDFRSATRKWFGPHADVKKAKELLAEAGYPDGKGFPAVTYKYNTNDNNKMIAEALQAMWKQNLGVQVNLYNEEWKVFINTRRQKDFQIARHGYNAEFADPSSLLDLWTSDAYTNYAGYVDPEYDRLVIGARTELDHDTRMNNFIKAEELLLDNMVVLPLNYTAAPYMISDHVKGFFMSAHKWLLFRGVEIVD